MIRRLGALTALSLSIASLVACSGSPPDRTDAGGGDTAATELASDRATAGRPDQREDPWGEYEALIDGFFTSVEQQIAASGSHQQVVQFANRWIESNRDSVYSLSKRQQELVVAEPRSYATKVASSVRWTMQLHPRVKTMMKHAQTAHGGSSIDWAEAELAVMEFATVAMAGTSDAMP